MVFSNGFRILGEDIEVIDIFRRPKKHQKVLRNDANMPTYNIIDCESFIFSLSTNIRSCTKSTLKWINYKGIQ